MHKTGDVLRSTMRAIPRRGAIQKKLIYAGLLGGLLFSSTNCFAANYSCGTASESLLRTDELERATAVLRRLRRFAGTEHELPVQLRRLYR